MPTPPKSNFIVGIGSSAGGLEAMLELLPCLRATTHIRFVVAQHMAKIGHSELMIRVLDRKSSLPVVEAQHNEVIEPDKIYVIPSSWNGIVKNGQLMLTPMAEMQLSAPSVNVLFESIAADTGSNSIGIILSGTGSDGVKGCKAIKEQGGKVFIQTPESATYNGMPSAALRSGFVDQQLTPDALANLINNLIPLPKRVLDKNIPRDLEAGPPELLDLIGSVSKLSGVKFARYKEDTLLRRIDGRMKALGMSDINKYAADAQADPKELEVLGKLFFVSLSWFFRDVHAFRKLRDLLLEYLLQMTNADIVRIWVPGCATGEECYTIAILLTELIDEHGLKLTVEVIGSDLNATALRVANRGSYPLRAFKELQLPELIAKHFIPEGEQYRISDHIRAACTFRQEDVIAAVPPSNLALVSCRNLLIYMKPELQKEMISKFYQALRPAGLLFLGMSENIGFSGDSGFNALDSNLRIYRRN